MGGPPGWTGRGRFLASCTEWYRPSNVVDLGAEHAPADLHGFLEAVHALRHGRELHPQSVVLDVVPGGADAELAVPR